MARRRGLQVEILLSLAVVMATATAVLGAVLVKTHEANVRQLHRLVARSLLEDAQSAWPPVTRDVDDPSWWRVHADGRVVPWGDSPARIPPALRALAAEVRDTGHPLLRAGPPWEAVRFAAPVARGSAVAAAEIPPTVSRLVLVAMLVMDVVIFTTFGAYLLRRRLVLPLERLAGAARALADGASDSRAPESGTRETWEVGVAFNEMTEALEGRSEALEKAVMDLRESNRHLREARAGLDRAERLAAVGRLAAGVAHEVGNPMGALLAFLDLARREEGLSEVGRGYLARAGTEGQRVRGILRQLLDFSRPPRGERAPLDLGALCEETAGLVRAQRSYADISISVERVATPPLALADRNATAQILLNLLLNAADALASAATPKPTIRIETRAAARSVRAGDDAEAASARRAFDAVECRVVDNGPGIPPEDRERIFDPFFSTKDPGKGTGLGLSNAARFAEELGGSLTLDAEDAGPGAAFVLRLPAANAESADREARRPSPGSRTP